jgi:ABC-type dipeptide/oligopeptide/nickel transport system permease component
VFRYLLRRLLHLGPVLLGVSAVVFLVLHITPGDPALIMLGSQATQADLSRLRAAWGSISRSRSSTSPGSARCCAAISAARCG